MMLVIIISLLVGFVGGGALYILWSILETPRVPPPPPAPPPEQKPPKESSA